MPISTPTQLVDEFKKSGEFDRLRRELLNEFRNGESLEAFMSRVEDITKKKLAAEPKLQYMPEAMAARELMQELDRYPIVERAVSEVRSLSDPAFASGIRDSARKILEADRKGIPTRDVLPARSRQGSDRNSGASLPPTPILTAESPYGRPVASPLPPTPSLTGESPRRLPASPLIPQGLTFSDSPRTNLKAEDVPKDAQQNGEVAENPVKET